MRIALKLPKYIKKTRYLNAEVVKEDGVFGSMVGQVLCTFASFSSSFVSADGKNGRLTNASATVLLLKQWLQ